MDIEQLSVEEIKALQDKLEDSLKEREAAELQDIVSKIQDLVAISSYEMQEVLSILQEGLEAKKVRYQHPTDSKLTWSGRGRMPLWLHELIEDGNNKEDYFMK